MYLRLLINVIVDFMEYGTMFILNLDLRAQERVIIYKSKAKQHNFLVVFRMISITYVNLLDFTIKWCILPSQPILVSSTEYSFLLYRLLFS